MNYFIARAGIELAGEAFSEGLMMAEAEAEAQGFEKDEYSSTRWYLEVAAPVNLSDTFYLGPTLGWNYRESENHFVYQAEEDSGINDIDHHFSESGHGYQFGFVTGLYSEPIFLKLSRNPKKSDYPPLGSYLYELGLTFHSFNDRWETAIRFTEGVYARGFFQFLLYSELIFHDFGTRFHFGLRLGITL